MSDIGRYTGQPGDAQQQPPPPQRGQHPLANYHFSSDELRILRECNTESFFQRSLPLGTGFGLAAYYGVKYGKLTPNARFGPVPKVVVSVIFGYLLGKVSYQRRCAEKIMQLPNSKLAEILRQKHKTSTAFLPDQGLGTAGYGLPFMQPKSEIYDDFHLRRNTEQSNSLDLDTERPSFGDDPHQRQNIDVNSDPDLPLEPPKHKVSYEELRKQNREEYLRSTSDIGSNTRQQQPQLPLESPPPVVRAPTPQTTTDDEQYRTLKQQNRKNQYGDVWS